MSNANAKGKLIGNNKEMAWILKEFFASVFTIEKISTVLKVDDTIIMSKLAFTL